MKYAIVILDGAADEPLAELDGQTVLEKAHIPNIDWISTNGRQGMVHTIPNGYPPGSDVGLMTVLGYNPEKYYKGRAPLEAAAQGIETEANDWVFRCNLVTIADGIMEDFSAGHINSLQGKELITAINDKLGDDDITFYPGVSYRNLMVCRSGNFDMEIAPPHDIMDQPVSKYLPKGKNGKKLVKLMEAAHEILAAHDINQVRQDLGENTASDIWLWGQGHKPQMDAFRKRFGISAAVITAVDLMRGLGKLMGMKVIEVEGATGYLDTNYAGKGQAAIKALADKDLIIVHVEAPDEAGHGALVEGKIKAIEDIDKHIVGPLLKYLQNLDEWRIMALPDHPTPIRIRTHSGDPVPFVLAGTDISKGMELPYSEANGKKTGLNIAHGHDLMEYFLKAKA